MPGADPAPPADWKEPAHATYSLWLLASMTFFYQLDRNAIYVVQELIKIEFQLSDTQLGLLTGVAYGVANGVTGLLMGWLVDRVVRVRLLGGIIIAWSALTFVCGMVSTFGHFLLARIGVGAAESGGTPTSLAIVSDLYPPKLRSSRVGWISSGYFMGTLLSFLAGGYIAAQFGWRYIFFIYGLPGIALGLLILFTMREPERQQDSAAAAISPSGKTALFQAIAHLFRVKTLGLMYLTVALNSTVAAGVFSWWSSFMIRVHDLDIETVGLIGTVGLGVSGLIGVIGAGYIADKARERSAAGPLFVLALAATICFTATACAIWTGSVAGMIAALFVAGGTVGIYIGPGNAVISELAPSRHRGLAFAIPVIITNLCGVAIGPLLVGMLSDNAQHFVTGVEPLRFAMFTVSLLLIPVALIYLLAARLITGSKTADVAVY